MSENLPGKKKKKQLTVLEAANNLSNLAELDVLADEQKNTFTQEKIKETFEAMGGYLQHLYQKERSQLRDLNVQIGIQAIMQLAGEAAIKIRECTEIFKGTTKEEEEIPEYQKLKQFYLSKIVTKLKSEEETPHREEILAHTQEITLEKQAIKDLESVRHDKDYELFYMHKEDGLPFFNENLERHIHLLGRFDHSLNTEGLFKKMDVALDRDYHVSAQEILQKIEPSLESFYKEALKYKSNSLIGSLSKALMALMLAANPKNLIHNTEGKSCLDYFIDFQRYLRDAFSSDEYFQLLYVELPKESPFFIKAKKLAHTLCTHLFLRLGAVHESIDLVKALFKNEPIKFSSFFATLSGIDEAIRSELSQFPSGPLLQILEELDKKKEAFDPILQKNAPFQFFSISSEAIHTTFIHLPCPTKQDIIDKATLVPEFLGYLHGLDERKHLLVNMQDLTSWKDHARSLALETLSKDGKFENKFLLVTFPKDTDFYHQQNEYKDLHESSSFKTVFKEQIASGKQCGFYIPSSFDISPWIDFIHENFYQNKQELSLKERQDFIEIFYFFSLLLIIEKTSPDIVSFTSKDGIDIGSCSTASFFGFAKILSNNSSWTEEEKEFFLFSFYKSAALVRHRAPHSERVARSLSALEHFEGVFKSQRDQILKACAQAFPDLPLHKFLINNVA